MLYLSIRDRNPTNVSFVTLVFQQLALHLENFQESNHDNKDIPLHVYLHLKIEKNEPT